MITLCKVNQTKQNTIWNIEYNGKLYRVATLNNPKRKGVSELRYVIRKTLKLYTNKLIFIGNRRESGYWVTEWITDR